MAELTMRTKKEVGLSHILILRMELIGTAYVLPNDEAGFSGLQLTLKLTADQFED
jgi:hypothetical protein